MPREITEHVTVEGNLVYTDEEGRIISRKRVVHNEDGSTTFVEDPDMSTRMVKSPFEGTYPGRTWEEAKKEDPIDALPSAFVFLLLKVGVAVVYILIIRYIFKGSDWEMPLIVPAFGLLAVNAYSGLKELHEVNQNAKKLMEKEKKEKKEKK